MSDVPCGSKEDNSGNIKLRFRQGFRLGFPNTKYDTKEREFERCSGQLMAISCLTSMVCPIL